MAGKVLFGGVDVKHLSSGAAVRVVTGHMRGATACARGRWGVAGGNQEQLDAFAAFAAQGTAQLEVITVGAENH